MKDCCAATCSQSNCGLGALPEAFGVTFNISGNGFPDCKNPAMVPLVLSVYNFVSSFEPRYYLPDSLRLDQDSTKQALSKFGSLREIRANFDEFVSWLEDNNFLHLVDLSLFKNDPLDTYLDLYCDQRLVVSINLDYRMENKSHVVKVEDGAKCTLDIDSQANTRTQLWYINYTIFHDEDMQIKINEGFTYEDGLVNFRRVQDCFLDTLFSYGYNLDKITYSELTRKLEWINKHDPQNKLCSDNFSIERYALSMMNFAITTNGTDDSGLWMTSDMYCLWPSIDCERSSVIRLDLSIYNDISGYIPLEIGLLSNLQRLDLGKSGLTGSIPTEVFSLSKLTHLNFSEYLFLVSKYDVSTYEFDYYFINHLNLN